MPFFVTVAQVSQMRLSFITLLLAICVPLRCPVKRCITWQASWDAGRSDTAKVSRKLRLTMT